MKYIAILFILLFYVFFFLRAYFLSKSIGRSIKAKNPLLNTAIAFAGLSSILFLIYLLFPGGERYFLVPYTSTILFYIGSLFIAIGLVISSIASLSLRHSWRIGIDEREKTDLITDGIYSISRNPYFLAYDVVLLGMVLCVPSPFLMITTATTIILFHTLILKEEKYLETQHPLAYVEYKKTVRRYI